MPPHQPLPASPAHHDDADADADLARAFQELAKGERTASVMETQLTALEHKIDDLLATVDSAPTRRSEADGETTETRGKVAGRGGDQPAKK